MSASMVSQHADILFQSINRTFELDIFLGFAKTHCSGDRDIRGIETMVEFRNASLSVL
jgi:hypothetical protein